MFGKFLDMPRFLYYLLLQHFYHVFFRHPCLKAPMTCYATKSKNTAVSKFTGNGVFLGAQLCIELLYNYVYIYAIMTATAPRIKMMLRELQGGKNLLFHSFHSQLERSAFGGSDFVEIQYCKLKRCTAIEEIVSSYLVEHWEDDSLYIYGDDLNRFCDVYGEIITGGTYANLESGYLDWCGINYFTPEQTTAIIKRLKEEKPPEHQTLVSWLEMGKPYNGFYVLGL